MSAGTPPQALADPAAMHRIRLLEEKITERRKQQIIQGSVHLCIGQEAIYVGSPGALTPDDRVFSSVRIDGNDVAAVRECVAHHARLEANVSGDFGAGVAARVQHALYGQLATPVERLGVDDCRMPAAPHLQAALIPDTASIEERAGKLARII